MSASETFIHVCLQGCAVLWWLTLWRRGQPSSSSLETSVSRLRGSSTCAIVFPSLCLHCGGLQVESGPDPSAYGPEVERAEREDRWKLLGKNFRKSDKTPHSCYNPSKLLYFVRRQKTKAPVLAVKPTWGDPLIIKEVWPGRGSATTQLCWILAIPKCGNLHRRGSGTMRRKQWAEYKEGVPPSTKQAFWISNHFQISLHAKTKKSMRIIIYFDNLCYYFMTVFETQCGFVQKVKMTTKILKLINLITVDRDHRQ